MTVLVMDSPVGKLVIDTGPSDRVRRIDFAAGDPPVSSPEELAGSEPAMQLKAFFAGSRRQFELDFDVEGTDFQQQVWQQIAAIPYGETATYGDIARALGKPGASRAVGAACGRNPISIAVPCHRVIGSGDKLTGFGGGLWRKSWLLNFEGRRPDGAQ